MSTDLLLPPAEAPVAAPKRRKRRKRFRFSLNALAIQLSAFALSVTLVALLVVSGSQAAFVEESEALQEYVPIGATEAPKSTSPRRPAPPPAPPAAAPPETPVPAPEPTPSPEPSPQPAPTVPSTVVRLSDNAAGTSMFGAETVLAPGTPSERCIVVSYTGDPAPQPVRLYAATVAGDLAPYLDLVVDIGEARAGAFGDCGTFTPARRLYSGTLAGFGAAHDGWSAGIDTWDPAGGKETRAFRFAVTVQDVAVAEGRSVRFGFSWEARDES